MPDDRHRALAADLAFACVGLVLEAGEPGASGVLLSPSWVLTAGHEVEGAVITSVGFGRSGAGASIITAPTPVGTKRAGRNVVDAATAPPRCRPGPRRAGASGTPPRRPAAPARG